MGALTVAALILTILYLAYTYPDMFKSLLPDWLTGAEQNTSTTGVETRR
jgi:hypothetical protein